MPISMSLPVPESFSTAVPDVSVIIAVYNAMPYLRECLWSVVDQTLGLERIEVIAVDDGSHDGRATELAEWAAHYPQIRVMSQAHSGGPSTPRNKALDAARGRYVFVVDSDDHLGREALERLVAMADAEGSDVVLAKHVGVGRTVSATAYRHARRVQLCTSEVYRTLNSMKLIRRDLLRRESIRFPEDLWFGEDQVFMTEVYIAARVISVVGDYDCYYSCRRPFGAPLAARPKSPYERIAYVQRMMWIVGTRDDGVECRRRLLGRHLRALVAKVILPVARGGAFDESYRDETYARASVLCETWWDDAMWVELTALDRLRLYCFMTGRWDELERLARRGLREAALPISVVAGRAYLQLPFLDDSLAGLPRHLYDITVELRVVHRLDSVHWGKGTLRLTGIAYIQELHSGYRGTELLLRERATKLEYRIPVEVTATPWPTTDPDLRDPRGLDRGTSGFSVTADLATLHNGDPIPPGTWDLLLRVHAEGVTRTVRLGSERSPSVATIARRPCVLKRGNRLGRPDRIATLFYTAPHENLSIEVAERLALPEADGRGGPAPRNRGIRRALKPKV